MIITINWPIKNVSHETVTKILYLISKQCNSYRCEMVFMLQCQQFKNKNRWSGDNGDDAFTESLWCWESGEKQVVKWSAEGAGNDKVCLVCCDVLAYVSGWGYVGILLSARIFREIKVAPRIIEVYSSLAEVYDSVRGVFVHSFDRSQRSILFS